MYLNELKKWVKVLEGLAKMTNKGGSWDKTARVAIKGITDALAGLVRELDERELINQGPTDNWSETEQERVAREQYW